MLLLKQILRRILTVIFINKTNRIASEYYKNLAKENAAYIQLECLGDIYICSTFIGMYVLYGMSILSTFVLLFAVHAVPIESTQDRCMVSAMVYMLVTLYLATIGMRIANLYYLHTRTLYFDDHVQIKKYGREDRTITYDEIGNSIRTSRIRLHNGCMEIPYHGGITKLLIHEKNDETPDTFIAFLIKSAMFPFRPCPIKKDNCTQNQDFTCVF